MRTTAHKRATRDKVDKYQFIPVKTYGRASLSKKVAQIVGETMLDLGWAKRPVEKHELLEVARSESHPLHNEFEWDDSVAGEKYRLSQAAHMIRNVQIVPITDEVKGPPCRAGMDVVRVEPSGEQRRGFMFTPSVMSDEKLSDQVVQNALSALKTWNRLYKDYAKLKKAASVVAQLIESLESELES